MRILFVSHRLPFPPNRGGKIRPFNMIRHLCQNHAVVVASLSHSEEELREGAGLRDYCEELIAEVLPSPARWLLASRALFTRTPSSLAYFQSKRLHSRIQEAWRRLRFDAIVVHCAFAAQYVQGLGGTFRLLDFGDLDSAKWFEYSRYRRIPLAWGYKLEAKKLRRYEIAQAEQFDHCTLTTSGELEEFRSLGLRVPSTVIPNGVDFAYFDHRIKRESPFPVIVFLGRMDYFPNVDGILYFAREIFPRIRQKLPHAELRIVGSNPNRKVRKLARATGIRVTGYVPDVRSYLADADVSVVPLKIARGTQNKILECMAMGIPVITTTQAAKGVQAVKDEHFFAEDNAEQFAGRVVEIIQNRNLQSQLSISACKQVRIAHQWHTSMEILDEILERIAKRQASKTSCKSKN